MLTRLEHNGADYTGQRRTGGEQSGAARTFAITAEGRKRFYQV